MGFMQTLKEDLQEMDEELGVSDAVEEKREASRRKRNDDPVRVTCRACATELESAEIERCPHCGYDADFGSKRLMWSLTTGLFAITIIGIPFALVTWRKAQKYGKKEKLGVAKKHWS